jgi:hypothetical protein
LAVDVPEEGTNVKRPRSAEETERIKALQDRLDHMVSESRELRDQIEQIDRREEQELRRLIRDTQERSSQG